MYLHAWHRNEQESLDKWFDHSDCKVIPYNQVDLISPVATLCGQGFLLCLGVTSSTPREPYGALWFEFRLATCKVSPLPTVLSGFIQHLSFISNMHLLKSTVFLVTEKTETKDLKYAFAKYLSGITLL